VGSSESDQSSKILIGIVQLNMSTMSNSIGYSSSTTIILRNTLTDNSVTLMNGFKRVLMYYRLNSCPSSLQRHLHSVAHTRVTLKQDLGISSNKHILLYNHHQRIQLSSQVFRQRLVDSWVELGRLGSREDNLVSKVFWEHFYHFLVSSSIKLWLVCKVYIIKAAIILDCQFEVKSWAFC
jgi:hypothetical protein